VGAACVLAGRLVDVFPLEAVVRVSEQRLKEGWLCLNSSRPSRSVPGSMLDILMDSSRAAVTASLCSTQTANSPCTRPLSTRSLQLLKAVLFTSFDTKTFYLNPNLTTIDPSLSDFPASHCARPNALPLSAGPVRSPRGPVRLLGPPAASPDLHQRLH
jgi:hypothetical protein